MLGLLIFIETDTNKRQRTNPCLLDHVCLPKILAIPIPQIPDLPVPAYLKPEGLADIFATGSWVPHFLGELKDQGMISLFPECYQNNTRAKKKKLVI